MKLHVGRRDLVYLQVILLLLVLFRFCPRPRPVPLRGTLLESEPKESFYAKVVRLENHEIDLMLVVEPRETHFILEGSPGGLSVGEYLKFSLAAKNSGERSVAKVGHRALPVRRVTWLTDP